MSTTPAYPKVVTATPAIKSEAPSGILDLASQVEATTDCGPDNTVQPPSAAPPTKDQGVEVVGYEQIYKRDREYIRKCNESDWDEEMVDGGPNGGGCLTM
ncbi:hypothetical protein LTR37_011901 [Vermiconidia calcicola]|uniref:Uncharacterized protein n=1 Tax=Vermiconidia calcicola TaxID=1690605 RepID=A0ACC3N2D0_9PEZI|nr:hypothetical protein LTR37_011901 [Vermiconidia calcicola]